VRVLQTKKHTLPFVMLKATLRRMRIKKIMGRQWSFRLL
jgi:hypothetical protein